MSEDRVEFSYYINDIPPYETSPSGDDFSREYIYAPVTDNFASSGLPFESPSFASTYFEYVIDLSSYPTFYNVSFEGVLDAWYSIYADSTSEGIIRTLNIAPYGMNLVVNGDQTKIVYPSGSNGLSFDLSGLAYSSDEPIESLSLRFHYNSIRCRKDTYRVRVWTNIQAQPDQLFTFRLYTDESVEEVFEQEAQGNINNMENVESEWLGSMKDNFDALSLSHFQFPNGLVSGFGLITGIFNDLWNAMGQFRIAYVFPLTLALALLIVGRISKFSGRSSSKHGKGEG